MSVAEITHALIAMGFTLPANPNKAVGDAIRWEVRKGRVRKGGRNQYGYAAAPRTTEFRMRAAVNAALVSIGSVPVAVSNSLRHGTEEDAGFDEAEIWTTTADGRRALDLDALDAYEARSGRGMKTFSR